MRFSRASPSLLFVIACRAHAGASSAAPDRADLMTDTLVVYHAGSLAEPFSRLAMKFEGMHPGVIIRRESGGSVALARRALTPGELPDLLAVADYGILPRLLYPKTASWYAGFAGNAMVLAFTDRSRFVTELSTDNWCDILLRAGVVSGHSDPALDPGGYRTLLVFHLAARFYGRSGLGDSLERAAHTIAPPAGQSIYDMLRAGALDYVLTYRSSAASAGLRWIGLPRDIDLSDPALDDVYREVSVTVSSGSGSADSTVISGSPIIYGLTVPDAAPHAHLALAFAAFVLGDSGRAEMTRSGFLSPPRPLLTGSLPRELSF